MNTEDGVWSEQFKIASYDVDASRHATLEAIARHFLEAAWNHAEALGVGYSHLAGEHKAWVLSRFLLSVNRYPGWGETVMMSTWPRPAEALFALRDFQLADTNGETLLGGTSAWVVLDVTTRRPQRIERITRDIKTVNRRFLERDPEKLPKWSGATTGFRLSVRQSDLDVNGHVNSARYVAWILDSYPLQYLREVLVERIELNYVGETLAGEEASVMSSEITANEFAHSIIRAGGQEAVRARLRWKPRAP
jgi:acyl-ACP thioesterase